MGETLLFTVGMVGAGEAVQWVVLEAVFAFAGVVETGEVAGFVVVVVALVEVVVLLIDCVGVQALLIVVVVATDQLALLALVFLASFEQVRGECFAVEFDAGEVAALVMIESEAVVIR